jgi:aminoglycoside phosphotransferase (APT) family kinase protein
MTGGAAVVGGRRDRTDLERLLDTLIRKGWAGAGASITPLSGGVSSIVAVVSDAGASWVVKTPREQLDVSEEWHADRSRGANEAAILRHLGGTLGPIRVPRLLFFDEESVILGEELISGALGRGPAPTYREELLEGRSWIDVASGLGVAATALHQMRPPASVSGEHPRDLFETLRLDPYFRVTARRCPELSDPLNALIDETIEAAPRSIVHGDFTPKNLLVTGEVPVLLDWEVVHAGDPAFDTGVFTAHLVLKALRDQAPGGHEPPLAAARAFWTSYRGPANVPRSFRHAGAVVLARLHGKSPVDYLVSPGARQRAHSVGVALLASEHADLDVLVQLVRTAQPMNPAS